jgi:geranylgeranyl pyrophosphate synthase
VTQVKDITQVVQQLREHQELVIASADLEATEICADTPVLRNSVLRLLHHDGSRSSLFRLLPWPVAGALGADPNDSSLSCVLSRLWWAGAETLDDIIDGDFAQKGVSLSPTQATIASISCLTVLPESVVARQGLRPELERDLRRDLTECSQQAAEGQIVDVLPSTFRTASWKSVMRSYAAKTGAAYARDVVMTARLIGSTEEDIYRWRAFGTLFGVLQQLVNDRVGLTADETGDLAQGVATLLVAHTAEACSPSEREQLRLMAEEARSDEDARQELLRLLKDPDNLAGYNARIESIAGRLSQLWQTSTDGDSEYSHLAQWMLRTSMENAIVGDEGATAGSPHTHLGVSPG